MRYEGLILQDLRERLEIVETENAELRALMGFTDLGHLKYRALGLPPSGCSLLAALMARPMVTNDALRFALHPHDADARTDLCDNLVKVQVCHLRHRLSKLGIRVDTVWGRGYRMDPAEKAKVAALAP